MMNFDDAARLVKLQQRVWWATELALKKCGSHKSSEGYVELDFCLPGMFNDDKPYWAIRVYSYVLGPHRMHTWTAKTIDGALTLAEDAVKKWAMPYEMEEFEMRMSELDPPDDDFDDIPPPPGSPEAEQNHKDYDVDGEIPF